MECLISLTNMHAGSQELQIVVVWCLSPVALTITVYISCPWDPIGVRQTTAEIQ